MLNFRNVTFVFIVLIAAVVLAHLIIPVSIWIYALLFSAYLLFLAYGSIFVNSDFYVKALCSGRTNEKIIALTFDDGPDKEISSQVMQILNEHKAKGNFFCIGRKIESNAEIVKQMDQQGHIIGGHSYSHSVFFDFYPKGVVIDEMKKTQELIKSVTGKIIKCFRPPFGVTNPPIGKAVNFMNYTVIGWSIRSLDTVITDPDKVLKRVIKRLEPGAVILFHDSNPELPVILRKLLRYCSDNGYRCVGLDELLKIEAYE